MDRPSYKDSDNYCLQDLALSFLPPRVYGAESGALPCHGILNSHMSLVLDTHHPTWSVQCCSHLDLDVVYRKVETFLFEINKNKTPFKYENRLKMIS